MSQGKSVDRGHLEGLDRDSGTRMDLSRLLLMRRHLEVGVAVHYQRLRQPVSFRYSPNLLTNKTRYSLATLHAGPCLAELSSCLVE